MLIDDRMRNIVKNNQNLFSLYHKGCFPGGMIHLGLNWVMIRSI